MFIFKPTYLDRALVLLTVTYHVVVMCFGFRRHSTQNTYMLCTLFHTTTILYGMSRLNTYYYIDTLTLITEIMYSMCHIIEDTFVAFIMHSIEWFQNVPFHSNDEIFKWITTNNVNRNMRCYMLHWNLHVLNVLNKYILTIQIGIHIQIQDRIIFNSFSIHSMIQDILHIDVDFDDPFLLIGFLFFKPSSGYSQVYACTLHIFTGIIIWIIR